MSPFSNGRTTLKPAAAMRISTSASTANRTITASMTLLSNEPFLAWSLPGLQGLHDETCPLHIGHDDFLPGRHRLWRECPPLL